jgi:SAM-dependent methyltransferase
MDEYGYSNDYNNPLIAELYDQLEAYTDDVELIRRLIGDSVPLNILECFSGTGRILVPLARDGHRITGIEVASSMNALAVRKVAELGGEVQKRVTFKLQDVLDGGWGSGYDVVIMGANAFYELPSAETQERCVRFAYQALVPGGRLFIDNDDYKGDWGKGPFGKELVVFEGRGLDGTFGRWIAEGLSFDEGQGIYYYKRTLFTRTPDNAESCIEYFGEKHPVNAKEVKNWLTKYGFRILQVFGDRQGNPYKADSKRAIFWVEKQNRI